jgi:hypothetical protein
MAEQKKELMLQAASGDPGAALDLALEHDEPAPLRALVDEGNEEVLEQIPDERTLLEALAAGGDAKAAVALAVQYKDFTGADRLAKDVDAKDAFALFYLLDLSGGHEQGALRWLCRAANERQFSAMQLLARWHDTRETLFYKRRIWLQKAGVEPDDAVAFMWGSLMTEGYPASHQAISTNERISSADMARGEQLAKDWRPGDCPSPMYRIE